MGNAAQRNRDAVERAVEGDVSLRRVARLVLALSLMAACSGCGSLDRSIAFGPLSREDMAYGDALPEGGTTMSIKLAGKYVKTGRTATYWSAPIPVIYIKRFGRADRGYGLQRWTRVFPIWKSGHFMSFDTQGTPVVDEGVRKFDLIGIICYYDRKNLADSSLMSWRVSLLSLPFLGGCFAFGSGYLKILWIPIIR